MGTINLPVATARRWAEHIEQVIQRLEAARLWHACTRRLKQGLTTATGPPRVRQPLALLPPPRQWTTMSAQASLNAEARTMTVRLEVPARHAGEAVVRAAWRTLAISVFGPEDDLAGSGPILYRRAIPLPAQADPDSVRFHFEDDCLVINMQLMPPRRPPLRAHGHEIEQRQPARRRPRSSRRRAS